MVSISDMFSFGTLNNQNFSSFVRNNNKNNACTGSSINQKPRPNFSLLFNQFNDLSSDSINKNPGNMTSCKNYDINDIQKIKTKPNSLSLSLSLSVSLYSIQIHVLSKIIEYLISRISY